MKTKSKIHTVASLLLIGVLIFLGVTWWVNGREETWLYATCALIVLTSFIPILPKKNGGDSLAIQKTDPHTRTEP